MVKREFNTESNDNVLFVTSQCNNRCVMCCQPPVADNLDVRYEECLRQLRTAPRELKVIGITGGEPTLLGERLVSLLADVHRCLPDTAIHLLSNGRAFADLNYTKRLKEAAGDKLFVGVPLHSDYEGDHDLIAGCHGAYKETMYGLYNLAEAGIDIELRVVIGRFNYQRLPQMAEFIYKNIPFVGWVALMGMELTGYAVTKQEEVWVEPIDYKGLLAEAVDILDNWGIDVSVYNIPLCLLEERTQPFAVKSISDWKVKYLPECNGCLIKENCCGHFATSRRPFKGILSVGGK
ncbi:MAG: His-Xaa-Ser system radical SAM maturase HxsC [Bacteroidales bacterium]|nr:His-Xaa-Ser system radical SAM maturase HxsC [Bacteroidales bacterium]